MIKRFRKNEKSELKESKLSRFKRKHPILSTVGAIAAGVSSILGLVITVLALFAPGVIDAMAGWISSVSGGGFFGAVTMLLMYLNASGNRALCVFVIVWSFIGGLFTIMRFRERKKRRVRGQMERMSFNFSFTTPVVVAAMIGAYALGQVSGDASDFGQLAVNTPLLIAVGFAAIGAAIVTYARIQIGPSWDFGLMVNDKDPGLTVGGLYAIVRHPLYAGLDVLYFASSFLLFNGAIVGFAIACVGVTLNCIRARREDEYLSKCYDDWDDYGSNTPFMFPKL